MTTPTAIRPDEAHATKPPVAIAAIAGSLRQASWTRALLRATAARTPEGVEVTIWDGLEQVPAFNEDREAEPAHPAVADLRRVIGRADGLLILTPEYNGSYPGALKNALDWASRSYGASVLQSTPIAIVGTSQLPTGGAGALEDLKRMCTRIRADIVAADLAVGLIHTKVDADAGMTDPDLADEMDQILAAMAARVRA